MVGIKDILARPIPEQSMARKLKTGARDYPLLDGARNDEPLVDISLYGLAGQSYYSRSNFATGKPVPGIEPAILVRESVAERLAAINYELQTSAEVQELFGRPVELYVDEGFRSTEMQTELYEEVFPKLIQKQAPEMTDDEVLQRRNELIARPTDIITGSPSPHATGAAVDLKLRYANPELRFVPKSFVPMGTGAGNMSSSVHVDYFELQTKLSKNDELYRRNRRIFYWVMRGALLGDDSGFMVNPNEWWHWSHGDQMWATLTHAPTAFFGNIEKTTDAA